MDLIQDHEHTKQFKNLASITDIAIKSSRRLKNFLRRWEKDDNEIEDIIGDALLSALQSIDSYSGESSIEAWFYGVCKNTARQHIASKVKMNNFIIYTDKLNEVIYESHYNIELSPDQELDFKERLINIEKSVACLPKDLQFVFQSIYKEGRQYLDVAHQLDIPVGTLKSRVNRMRSSLTKEPQQKAAR
jgi:RNA polymerase sigma factor (sigma-70 family)